MTWLGGVFEGLVALLVIGWGFYELRNLKRDKRKAEDKARAADEAKEL